MKERNTFGRKPSSVKGCNPSSCVEKTKKQTVRRAKTHGYKFKAYDILCSLLRTIILMFTSFCHTYHI